MSNVTTESLKPVRTIGLFTIIAGIILMLGGATTWFVVTDQLKAANITVADDADWFAGKQVNGPFDALSQAAIIDKHALKAAGGKTYAELAQDDPIRAVAMNAAFLRSSLFTSVVAYGVAAFAAGMGLMMVLLGWSLRRLAP